MSQTSVQPMNIEAEGRIIGSLLISPENMPHMMGKLSAKDFMSNQCRAIYDAMCTLDIGGKPISAETVFQHLTTVKMETGAIASELFSGPADIITLANGVDTTELEFWTEEVHNKSDQRSLLDLLEKSRERVLRASGDIKTLRTSIEEGLVSLGGGYSPESSPISAGMDQLYARINKYIDDPNSIAGLASGWRGLDEVLDGYQKGNVTIVYAPTSRFKSLWTSNLGYLFALQQIPGLWFTTEMPMIQIKERLLQLEAGINIKWLRRDGKIGKHRDRISLAIERLKTLPIYFNDTSALNISNVRSEISRHKRWNNIEYVIIDLVDHIYSSRFKDEMFNNQRVVMQAVKGIAKDFDVHVVLVSHVRKAEKDLKDSADLDSDEMTGTAAKSQDVDVSISLMPIYWSFEDNEWKGMTRLKIMEAMFDRNQIKIMVSVTKNRHGELFRYIMNLDLSKGGVIEPDEDNRFYQDNPYIKKREQKELDLGLAIYEDE